MGLWHATGGENDAAARDHRALATRRMRDSTHASTSLLAAICRQHSSHRKRVVHRVCAARAKYLQGAASTSRLLSSLARLRSCGTARDDVEPSREVLRALQDVRHVRIGSVAITEAPVTVLHACARLDGQHRLQKPTSHGGLAWLAGPSLQAHLQSAAISQRL